MLCLFLYGSTLQLVLKFRSPTHRSPYPTYPRNYHAFRQWEGVNRELISPTLLYVCLISSARVYRWDFVPVCVYVCMHFFLHDVIDLAGEGG